uniref:Phosphatidate cytidylyltransferase, mitochondrial n=1 Tax=Blastobotrys adeninivorans TaxID=409370 RepID=A0A060TA93_BLAAD
MIRIRPNPRQVRYFSCSVRALNAKPPATGSERANSKAEPTVSASPSSTSSGSEASSDNGSSKSSSSSSSTVSSELSMFDLNLLNVQASTNIRKFSDLPQSFGYNQHVKIDNEMREKLRSVLWKFKAPIRYAFAYGSGVFSQGAASKKSNPQIDLIFAVSHTQHWHSLNIKQFPEHYSGLRMLGSGTVSMIQDHLGAGVYFNPYVEMNGLKIKYGVVNVDTLLHDLGDWSTLYLAGRLHKPVKILRDEPKVRFVNQANLLSVLRAALLLLPEEFTELELYKMIASVSYMGDFRMTFGENPKKIDNIVNNQFLNFRRLYSPFMDSLPNLELGSAASHGLSTDSNVSVATLRQDRDPVKRGNMVVRLPAEFKYKLYRRYATKLRETNPDDPHLREAVEKASTIRPDPSVKTVGSEFDRLIAKDEDLSKEVSRIIRHTVAWPSISQSVKGILTAGMVKSVKYSSEKLKKYYQAK